MEIRLNKYVQEKLGISRRSFVALVKKWTVFVNNQKVDSYSSVLIWWELLEIKTLKIKKKIENISKVNTDIIIFNKPIWFVCSKSDKYNKTIYQLLPKEFKNYFYIGRLDKDSRGLLLMTNNSSFVNKYEHPSNQIEKEYIVQIDKEFKNQDLIKIKKWIKDDWEDLRVKSCKYFEDKRKFFMNIILLEWKKRHIRRILSSLWYDILDLQRVREWEFKLSNIKEGNWFQIKNV